MLIKIMPAIMPEKAGHSGMPWSKTSIKAVGRATGYGRNLKQHKTHATWRWESCLGEGIIMLWALGV